MTSQLGDIARNVANAVSALAPFVGIAVPGVAPALEVAVKIVQGVIAAEPAAVALYNRIMDGEIPTAEELRTFAAEYEDAYQALKADIAEKLAHGT